MGYSLFRLETIKNRFLQSSDQELNILLSFLREQLDKSNHKEHESKHSVVFERAVLEKIKSEPSMITSAELEDLLDFIEERIEISRNSDRGDRILGKMDTDTFYAREELYTSLEKHILKLTIG